MSTPTDRLWAPWRSAYLIRASRRSSPCIFCLAKRSRHDRKALVIYRGRTVFGLLNRYPYNNGHLMVTVYRHLNDLSRLTQEETTELMAVMALLIRRLTRLLHPDGFNIGLNLGRAAGAGIPGHLHWHLVPRWHEDTNFMPVTARTKVISESLEALYDRLHASMAGTSR